MEATTIEVELLVLFTPPVVLVIIVEVLEAGSVVEFELTVEPELVGDDTMEAEPLLKLEEET